MKSETLELSGFPYDICAEADTGNKSVELTIETGAYQSVHIQRSGLVMLRNFINEFLMECEEDDTVLGDHPEA